MLRRCSGLVQTYLTVFVFVERAEISTHVFFFFFFSFLLANIKRADNTNPQFWYSRTWTLFRSTSTKYLLCILPTLFQSFALVSHLCRNTFCSDCDCSEKKKKNVCCHIKLTFCTRLPGNKKCKLREVRTTAERVGHKDSCYGIRHWESSPGGCVYVSHACP